jgi:hypothetical protein
VRLENNRSGLELLPALRGRSEFRRIPVLVMTGGVLSDAEEAWIAKHRAHLFYKPEGFDTLLNFLDSMTGRDQPT